MSPEQVQNRQIDVRTDIYALGVTLYQMLSGHVPFESDSDFKIMNDHLTTPPPSLRKMHPYAPLEYENAVMKAMEKNPDNRYQTVEEFGAALEHPESVGTPATSVGSKPTVLEAPRPMVAGSAALAAAAAPARAPQTQPAPAVASSAVAASGGMGTARKTRFIAAAAIVVALVLLAIVLFGRKPPAAQPGLTAGVAPQPAGNPPTGQPQVEVSKPAGDTTGEPSPGSQPGSGPANQLQRPSPGHRSSAASNGPDPAEVEQLEHEIDQLSARAASVSASLNRMQQQQAAAGYGMRGDITSRQASMENNLAKADAALNGGDIGRASRYADLTAADLEALEKFLGR